MLFALNVLAQDIPSHVPKDGLVGWWPFNGNANDESGNGRNGLIMNGVTLAEDRNGTPNSAYNFNGGATSYITVSNRFQSVNANGNNGVTIAFWFYSTSSSEENSDFYDFRSTDNSSLEIVINSTVYEPFITNNTANLYVANFDGPTQRNAASYYANSNYKTNKWNYITVVNDYKNNSSKLYLNGNIVGQKDTILPILFSPRLNFGSRYDINDSKCCGFKGSLDDFGIWNRALTPEEITALYTGTPLCMVPNAPIVTSPIQSICGGTSVKISATGALTGETYNWYDAETGGQLLSNESTYSTPIIQEGDSRTYWVSISNGACESKRTLVVVNAKYLPKIEGVSPVLVCNGAMVQSMSFSTSPKDAKVYWSVKNVSIGLPAKGMGTLPSFTSVNTTPNDNISEVEITPSFDGCIGVSKIFTITVHPTPKVEIGILPSVVYKTTPMFSLVGVPSGGKFSGDGVVGASFDASVASLGKHTIYYKFIPANGCGAILSRSIIVADTVGTICSSVDTLKIKLKLTTGVHANEITNLNVYPNPTTELLIIDAADVLVLEGYKYRILDLQGKEVYNSPIAKSKTEINLKSLGAKGVYVLHIIDGKGTSIDSKKIVLE